MFLTMRPHTSSNRNSLSPQFPIITTQFAPSLLSITHLPGTACRIAVPGVVPPVNGITLSEADTVLTPPSVFTISSRPMYDDGIGNVMLAVAPP